MFKLSHNIRIRRVIHGAGLLYVFSLTGLFVFNHFARQTSPLVALISTFNLYLFIAALPLIICLVLLRTRMAWAILISFAVLFLSTHPVLPSVSSIWRIHNESGNVSAMTFNLGGGITSPGLLAQTIQAAQADLVAVQELTVQTADVLEAELTATYPYRILEPSAGSTGFLSKLPIVSYQWLNPPFGRPFLHIVVARDGEVFHVFAVHLQTPGITWLEPFEVPSGIIETGMEGEVSYLLQQVVGLAEPVVVLGDFNMSDQSRAYRAMNSLLYDGFRQAGFGFGRTFPNNIRIAKFRIPNPLLRIDYIFHSPHMEAIAAEVNCIEGQSDHCAVQVTLGFKKSRQSG